MAHAQKPDFVFRRNGRVHLNRRGSQFSRLLEAEVCASAVVMLDTPCSEVVWRVLATHFIRQFPLHFPYPASPCAIIFQLEFTSYNVNSGRKEEQLICNLRAFLRSASRTRSSSVICWKKKFRVTVQGGKWNAYFVSNVTVFLYIILSHVFRFSKFLTRGNAQGL